MPIYRRCGTMQNWSNPRATAPTILVKDGMPGDVPGFADYENARGIQQLTGALQFQRRQIHFTRRRLAKAHLGSGANLNRAGTAQAARGQAARSWRSFRAAARTRKLSHFLANRSDKAVDAG